MKLSKQAALGIVLIFNSLFSIGQEDLFNMQIINPAYCGYWKTIGFIGQSRFYDVGIDGVFPKQTISLQAPIDSLHSGIGFNTVFYREGFESRNSFFIDYSYQILNYGNASLRIGVKGGADYYNNHLTDYHLYPDGIPDSEFQSDIHKLLPNIGFGLFLASSRYYIGLSAPKLIRNSYTSEIRSLLLSGGMLIDLSGGLKFKPAFLTGIYEEGGLNYDLSANFLISKKIWLGGVYRSGEAVGFIGKWIGFKKMNIGYACDFYTHGALRRFTKGNHEIMLSYEIGCRSNIDLPKRYF